MNGKVICARAVSSLTDSLQNKSCIFAPIIFRLTSVDDFEFHPEQTNPSHPQAINMNRLTSYFQAEHHQNQFAATTSINRLAVGAGIILTASVFGPGISYFYPAQNLNQLEQWKKRTGARSIFDLGLRLTKTYLLPTTFGGLAVTAGIINVAWTANVVSELDLEGLMKLKDAIGLIGVLGLTIWTGFEATSWLKWGQAYEVDDAAERERERLFEMENLMRQRESEEARIRSEQESKMARIRSEHESKMAKLQLEDERKREAKKAEKAKASHGVHSYRPAGSLSGFFESKDKESKKEKKPSRSRKAKSLHL